MSWLSFAGVFAAFLVTHSVPVRPPVKARLVQILGAAGFTIAYSLLSAGMLAWLIAAAADAPYVPLWSEAPWQRSATFVGMFGVCLLLAFAIGRPNPFSFGGICNDGFDPAHPGLIRWSRHPLLLALALWAGLHVLPNGNLAHVVLFGVFTGFSVLGMKIVDRRKQRTMGATEWLTLKQKVSAAPLWSRPRSGAVFAVRLALGVLGFLALLLLHPLVIGVSPLP